MTEIPRGIRNNNAGNIRHSTNQWQGMSATQDDDSFVTFDTPVMGIRAIMKLMINYYNKYSCVSVWEIISRWAPPNENKTDLYAADVAKIMGVDMNEDLNIVNDSSQMIKLVQGIIHHENGAPPSNWIYKNEPFWYPMAIFQAAWTAANGGQ